MSVTLLHCPKCGNYSTSAMVNLVVSATLNANDGEFWIKGDIYPEHSIPLEDFVEGYCNECDSPDSPSPTEIVTLDECPHWYPPFHGCIRVCAYCGERQVGRVVFDE